MGDGYVRRGEVFTGRVLNGPTQLELVKQGQEVRFVVPAKGDHPVMVTDKYLRERPSWIVRPCVKCGFTELFDAPSDLIKVLFPNSPSGLRDVSFEVFTSLCPVCAEGMETVILRGGDCDTKEEK